jgi:hypothetical protein
MLHKRQSLWADSARETSPGECKVVFPIFDLYEIYFIFGTGELGIRRHTKNMFVYLSYWTETVDIFIVALCILKIHLLTYLLHGAESFLRN